MAEEKKYYKDEEVKDGSKEEVKEEEVKEASQELAPKGESALRISGKGGTALGFEDVDLQDIQLPRVAVLQGLSKLVTEGDGKPGQLAKLFNQRDLR